MRRLLVILAACGGGDPLPLDGAAAASDAFAGDPLAGIGAVELVDDGYMFLEGPAWSGTALVFSDIPANTIYRYEPGTPAPVVELTPSNMSNGLAFGLAQPRYAAEHGSRSVTMRLGTQAAPLAEMFEGRRLNSPNDLVVVLDSIVYFTDPPFGIADTARELDFIGVFRIASGVLTAEHRGALTERPNGLGISPDGAHLYVDDSADGKLYRFAIAGDSDGALRDRELFATTAGSPDGLAIDAAGNIFVTTTAGIEVFAPDGSRWGAIAVPEQPANCAFGDADLSTLYITARTSLYKVRLAHPGLPRN